MKYLILLSLLCLNVKAEDCTEKSSVDQVEEQKEIKTDVPKHLKGAKIIVRMADGRESVVPAEKFKVVPRKQQYLVTKVKKSTVVSCTSLVAAKNRISVMAGEAPTGHLDRDDTLSPSKVEVSSERGLVGGVQYQRDLGLTAFGLPVHAGAQVQTNKSLLIDAGVSF